MYKISFNYKGSEVPFEDRTAKSLYSQVLNWLYDNGYEFTGTIHSSFVRKPHTMKDIQEANKSRGYVIDDFIQIKNHDIYFYRCGNINKIYPNIILMLKNFGIDVSQIKSEGLGNFSVPRVRSKSVSNTDLDIIPFDKFKSKNEEPDIEPDIEPSKQNPFKQSICVLGESGAGKSTTILNLLKESGHKVQFIIPSISTTGLLSQFSPSKNYIPSRLGKFLIQATEDPKNFYTVVFDECHKSNIIEMINDELLQAISTKRNNGRRFLPLDDTTEYLSEYLEEDEVGNLLVPDNFGFIFISSKPKVIANNEDFFNRVEFAELLRGRDIIENEDGSVTSRIKSISDLLSLVDLTDRSKFKSLKFED